MSEVDAQRRAQLESYDKPAILLSRDYRILAANRAYRSRYRRPVREGVDQCFRISHGYDTPCDQNGESCPLRGALESRRKQRVFHIHQGPQGEEHVDVALHPLLGADGEVEAETRNRG